MIVGAGDGPCLVLAAGAREHQEADGWGGSTVGGPALGHGAGVEQETTDPGEADRRFPAPVPTRYVTGWLPGETD